MTGAKVLLTPVRGYRGATTPDSPASVLRWAARIAAVLRLAATRQTFLEKRTGSRTCWYKLLDAPVLSLDVTDLSQIGREARNLLYAAVLGVLRDQICTTYSPHVNCVMQVDF